MRIRYAMRLTSRLGEDLINANKTIGQIARSEPAAIEVFRSLGIQYCCHGKEEIASASKTIGISAAGLLTKVYQAKLWPLAADDSALHKASKAASSCRSPTHSKYGVVGLA